MPDLIRVDNPALRQCAAPDCGAWFERQPHPGGGWGRQEFCSDPCQSRNRRMQPDYLAANRRRLEQRRRGQGVGPRKSRGRGWQRRQRAERALRKAAFGTRGKKVWLAGYCESCGSPFVGGRASVCSKTCRRRVDRHKRRDAYGHHRHRARHYGVKYEAVNRKTIFERDGYRCQSCGVKCRGPHWLATGLVNPLAPTLDHIVPMARGGDHVASNLQMLCFTCNSFKGDRAQADQLRLVG